MQFPIYLDYAATTPVDPRVAAKMWEYLTPTGQFGNPASSHLMGRSAALAVEEARQQVADLIHVDADEIIWTSGATEANNLAIKGVAHYYRNKSKHLITSTIEHEAVLESFQQLEQEGFSVTYLKPESSGLIDIKKLESALQANTVLVSIMHVNNEIGVVQDIAAMATLLQARGIYFHVDAAQSIGKIAIDLAQIPVSLMSFSAHKAYGPKGMGALYIRQTAKINLKAQTHGGGQERGLRSGTLPTHQIVGMGKAFQIINEEQQRELLQIKKLRDQLWDGLQKLENVSLNGDEQARVPNILNVAFVGLDTSIILPALKDLALSTGSACHAATLEPSRVLQGIGVPDAVARSSLRFSIGRFTTEKEVEYAINKITAVVTTLRQL